MKRFAHRPARTATFCLLAIIAAAAMAPRAAAQVSTDTALERIRSYIRPLTYPLGDRLPITSWDPPGFPSGLSEGAVAANQQVFLDRGFLPNCRAVSTAAEAATYLPIFKYWQSRGFPVCFLAQGWAQIAFDEDNQGACKCAHLPPADTTCNYPCPSRMLDDSRLVSHADRTSETMAYLRDHGVTVRMIVIDFETGAYLRNNDENEANALAQMNMAAQCPRCVGQYTADALTTLTRYVEIVNEARAHATKIILCDPARAVFPDILAGNFYAWPINRVPRPEGKWPAYGFDGSGMNVLMPRLYMNAGWGGAGKDQAKMNWNGFHLFLKAFSPAAAVRRPDELLIPYVHVWLGGSYLDFVMNGRKLPELWATNEMARHMLLRGAESFATWSDFLLGDFPPGYPYPEYAAMGQFVYDVKLVQEGFNDMLAHNAFLRRSTPMTFDVPGTQAVLGPETATWSGMQAADKALVRTVSFNNGTTVTKTIQAYSRDFTLDFPPTGQSYWLYPDGRVEPIKPAAARWSTY